MSIFGIVLSLVLLMFLAYRGYSVIVLAPLMAALATLFSGDFPALVGYTEVFMKALAGFVAAYFPVFLTGAIFGHLMGVSGASETIANWISNKLGPQRAILAVVLTAAILTYGGVSLFVVVFAVYPIACSLFKQAGIPKRLLPAAIALGSFTFTMTAMPGSPQYINTMPIKYFNSDIYAAPILGLISSALMFGIGMLWLKYRAKSLVAEGYGVHPDDPHVDEDAKKHLPSFGIAILPILLIFALNFVFTNWYFKAFAGNYLPAMEKMGQTAINGTWPVILSLSLAIVACYLLFRNNIHDPAKELAEGAKGSLLPILNTASEVGYGGVIKGLAAFGAVRDGIIGLSLPPLAKLAIATTSLAGVVGSSSGGTAIALEVMGANFAEMAQGNQAMLDVMHRISIMAAGGLDTMPHSGAVITLLTVTALTHKQSYKDIAMVTMAIPVVVVIIAILLAQMGVV